MYSSNSLKKIMLPKRIASAVFVIVLAFMTAAGLLGAFGADSVYAESYYDKDTLHYNVDMDVHKDNTMDVTETIVVDFKEQRHGIYRYIPLRSDVKMKKDGKVYEDDVHLRVKDVEVDGFEYETYTENDSYVIKIGSADEYVYGKYTYKIKYKIVVYEDGVEDFDYFYYNAVPMDVGTGSGWDTPIDQSEVTVRMPKAFDKKELSVYAGYYGITKEDSEAAGYVSTSVSGRTITVKTQKQLPKGFGITVQEFLPEGYYEGAANEGGMSLMSLIASAIVAIVSLVLFLLFGRDPKVTETVEFYPPDDMTSAEVGYVIDGYADDQDLVSLIMYYADKGYLTIEETGEGKKKDYILNKVKDLPPEAHLYETLFFNGLFMGSSTRVSIDDLKAANFYEDIKAAKGQLAAMYEENKEKRVFSKASDGVRRVSGFLMIVPAVCLALISAWFSMDKGVLYSTVIGLVIFLIGSIGLFSTYDRAKSLKKSKRRVKT
ncbi:MAG: DUF2207 domain-containing protein, partial [Firmicutes bacterium]|nr:DUF2207 domain-containing protein [Bacillota bacterium]